MKGRSIAYSPDELAWLEVNRTLSRAQYHAAFCIAFDRIDVSMANLVALRKRRGWSTGRSGRFEPGQVPANKGKPAAYHPNSAATRFKAGVLQGRAAQLHKPIGAERLSKDGFLERKIHEGLPMQSRWRGVHLLRWEASNGPLPAGHALKCLNGDRLDTAPSNWEAVPRGVLARLNGGPHKRSLAYDQAHPDVRPAIMAIAKLEHRARTAKASLR